MGEILTRPARKSSGTPTLTQRRKMAHDDFLLPPEDLEGLTEDEQIIVLRYLNGESVAAIADCLDIPWSIARNVIRLPLVQDLMRRETELRIEGAERAFAAKWPEMLDELGRIAMSGERDSERIKAIHEARQIMHPRGRQKKTGSSAVEVVRQFLGVNVQVFTRAPKAEHQEIPLVEVVE
jgi:hypothetical protein